MKQEISYGNITLSQIVHFAIELCGKDALTSRGYLSDAEINDAYKEKCVYEKFRYTDENSIFGKIRQFFTDLENEFDIQTSVSLAYLCGYWKVNEIVKKIHRNKSKVFRHGKIYPFWKEMASKSKLISAELEKIGIKK